MRAGLICEAIAYKVEVLVEEILKISFKINFLDKVGVSSYLLSHYFLGV